MTDCCLVFEIVNRGLIPAEFYEPLAVTEMTYLRDCSNLPLKQFHLSDVHSQAINWGNACLTCESLLHVCVFLESNLESHRTEFCHVWFSQRKLQSGRCLPF